MAHNKPTLGLMFGNYVKPFKPILCLLCMCASLAAAATEAIVATNDVAPALSNDTPIHTAQPKGVVVLLHGLGRSARAMRKLEKSFSKEGYPVCNIGYPSRDYDLLTLTEQFVLPSVQACQQKHSASQIHFVTHSMGGIVVRMLEQRAPKLPYGKVVMLAPPNHGSEVVDALLQWRVLSRLKIPAGRQLGTANETSVPKQLGATSLYVGVIAATKTINPLFSKHLPGKDDGSVTVLSTHLEGMKGFCQLPTNHTYIIRNKLAIAQVLAFIELGEFTFPSC